MNAQLLAGHLYGLRVFMRYRIQDRSCPSAICHIAPQGTAVPSKTHSTLSAAAAAAAQASAYFPEQLHEQLVDALLEYGEKQLVRSAHQGCIVTQAKCIASAARCCTCSTMQCSGVWGKAAATLATQPASVAGRKRCRGCIMLHMHLL
jgi:hypothetical protein